MNDQEVATNFIRARRIDSFQKLLFLLLLDQDPNLSGTSQEFAKKLSLDNVKLLEKIMAELQKSGVVVSDGKRYLLYDGADVRHSLQAIGRLLEDPAARKRLFDQVADYAFHTYSYKSPSSPAYR